MGLQARDKTVIKLVKYMHVFYVNLNYFMTALSTGRMLHFSTLIKCISAPAQTMDVMTDFMMRLKANFAGQVNRPTEVMGFARDLFNVATERVLFPKGRDL